jgi:cytidylate kinase
LKSDRRLPKDGCEHQRFIYEQAVTHYKDHSSNRRKIASLLQEIQMAIITISRGPFSKGKEVAEKVAKQLGYQCISDEVILAASQKYQIPPEKLHRAIHDAPSIYERFTSEKQKHIAYVATEALARFRNDNVVYHGLAGHFFAGEVTHLLKVRIVADIEERISSLMEKENLSREQALSFLKKEDRERKAWSRQFYGVDTTDPALYHLVIHSNKLTVDHAVDLICKTARQPQFTTTSESQQTIDNLALAAGIRAALLKDYPGCEVVAEGKSVEIYVRFTLHSDTMITEKIKEKVLKMPGVSSVSIILVPSVLFT